MLKGYSQLLAHDSSHAFPYQQDKEWGSRGTSQVVCSEEIVKLTARIVNTDSWGLGLEGI